MILEQKEIALEQAGKDLVAANLRGSGIITPPPRRDHTYQTAAQMIVTKLDDIWVRGPNAIYSPESGIDRNAILKALGQMNTANLNNFPGNQNMVADLINAIRNGKDLSSDEAIEDLQDLVYVARQFTE